MKNFRIKTLKDGRTMLNLGCGPKTNWEWNNIDFSPYATLARHRTFARILLKVSILDKERYLMSVKIDPDIIRWDLRNGIPFEDETFDVVYHSHFLEHLDRGLALPFLRECYRVLKRNSIIRVVVPSLEAMVNDYIASISALESGDETSFTAHEEAVRELIEPMVYREHPTTRQQSVLQRIVERVVRGNARKAGELHRWIYDSYTLGALLLSVGFSDVEAEDAFTSRIENFNSFCLDLNEDGSVYKSGSLWMEAVKK
ncbi:hypothetical protein ES706_01376 [subsurface metagenome]|nr:methyltransferase domain-containing protein [Dehalococcoidia bacterium]